MSVSAFFCLMWSLDELEFELNVCNQDRVCPQYVLPKSSVTRSMCLSIFRGLFLTQDGL